MPDKGKRQCILCVHMDTKNTWVDAHVYLVAIWPVNRHGHQTTLLSWPYGKMLDQTLFIELIFYQPDR